MDPYATFSVFCDLVESLGGRMGVLQINKAAPKLQQLLIDNPELLRGCKVFRVKRLTSGGNNYNVYSLDGEFLFGCWEDQLETRCNELINKGWKRISL